MKEVTRLMAAICGVILAKLVLTSSYAISRFTKKRGGVMGWSTLILSAIACRDFPPHLQTPAELHEHKGEFEPVALSNLDG